jgi:hypothetical protein
LTEIVRRIEKTCAGVMAAAATRAAAAFPRALRAIVGSRDARQTCESVAFPEREGCAQEKRRALSISVKFWLPAAKGGVPRGRGRNRPP